MADRGDRDKLDQRVNEHIYLVEGTGPVASGFPMFRLHVWAGVRVAEGGRAAGQGRTPLAELHGRALPPPHHAHTHPHIQPTTATKKPNYFKKIAPFDILCFNTVEWYDIFSFNMTKQFSMEWKTWRELSGREVDECKWLDCAFKSFSFGQSWFVYKFETFCLSKDTFFEEMETFREKFFSEKS